MEMRDIKVAIVPYLGIFEVNITPDSQVIVTGGLEAAFLNTISQALQVKYSANIPEDYEWGRLKEDGNWTGMVGMVHRGEADIAISRIAITEERKPYVDFSYPYYIEEIKFVTPMPGLLPTATAFIHPLSLNLWLTLFVLLLVMPIIFYFLLSKKLPLNYHFLVLYAIFLNQSGTYKTKATRDRILIFSWIIASFFISYSYVAVLLSYLTLPLRELGIRDIPQLSKAVSSSSFRCTTLKGTSFLNILLESNEESVRKIGEYIAANEELIEPEQDIVWKYLSKRKSAVITTGDDIQYLVNGDFYTSEDKFFSILSTVVLNKKFSFKNKLDDIIHRIWASGLYGKYVSDYLFRVQLVNSRSEKSESVVKQLTVSDIYGAFLLLISGYVLACISFTVEVIWKRKSLSKV